jgi:hypothetical protein
MGGWHVDVEVVVLRALPDGGLGYRWVRGSAPRNSSPDECARALTGHARGLCHSTSWRLGAPGALVLTYAALPDWCLDQPADPLRTALVVPSGEPAHPAPAEMAGSHVAAHAVRHLADLAGRDPAVQQVAKQDPELWSAIARTAGGAEHKLTGAAS